MSYTDINYIKIVSLDYEVGALTGTVYTESGFHGSMTLIINGGKRSITTNSAYQFSVGTTLVTDGDYQCEIGWNCGGNIGIPSVAVPILTGSPYILYVQYDETVGALRVTVAWKAIEDYTGNYQVTLTTTEQQVITNTTDQTTCEISLDTPLTGSSNIVSVRAFSEVNNAQTYGPSAVATVLV